MTTASLPSIAYVTALSALPEVGPARLRALLARGDPADVFAQLAAGALAADAALAAACRRSDPTPLIRVWTEAARALDPEALWARHGAAGIEVLHAGDPRWPPVLRDDPEPPPVLFVRGDVALLAAQGPRVAVVGTRRCSRYGWEVAHELGRTLAGAGVPVVSGLAVGIDAAAHRGVLTARAASSSSATAAAIAVVGTGLDVVYPRANAALWRDVAATGVVVSEAPLGTRPARWRFPARNRLIAAFADAVVVVESAVAGGALHTVDEAVARDRLVLAVPGPITSPVSAGTNQLIRDAVAPVCDPDDVLTTVGITADRRPVIDDGGAVGVAADPDASTVLDALGTTPATLDALAARTRLPLGRIAATLVRLQAGGVVADLGGQWERIHHGREVPRWP